MRWAIAFLAVAGCDRLLQFSNVTAPDAPVPDTPGPATCMLDVAVGRSHTCAIAPNGDVYCWGENFQGESQPGAGQFVATPTHVVLPHPAVQVGAGHRLSCARLDDGSVWCWGDHEYFQLSSHVIDAGPAQIDLGTDTAMDLEVGGRYACIMRTSDRGVMCWGRNKHSSLALAASVDSLATPSLVAGSVGAMQFSVGHTHGCYVDAGGYVWCWGPNFDGQAGDTTSMNDVVSPKKIATLGQVSAVKVSGRESCVVLPDGEVDCWGIGWDGQLGTGAFGASTASPTPTLEKTATAVAVASGGACTLHGDYTMSCWGVIDEGNGAPEVSPTPLATTVTGVTKIAAHFSHQCVLANGVVECWGDDAAGQLGRPSGRAIQTTSTAVPLSVSGVTAIASTVKGACALAGGAVYCWGTNLYGQIGNNTLVDQFSPIAVPGISNATGLAANGATVCAWGSGFAKCWGRNTEGGLGNGDDFRHHAAPVDFLAPSAVQQIAVGLEFTCAIVASGNVVCVGRNAEGEIGIGTVTNDELVAQSTGITGATKITAGERFACAITGGALYCWGYDADGELGDGGTANQSSPVHIITAETFSDVAAGRNHACAITTGTTPKIYCWGYNGSGQLGTGDVAPHAPTVVAIPSGTPEKIYAGGYTTCVETTGKSVYCWGEDSDGELGDGMTASALSPRLMSALSGATMISSDIGGNCALVGGAVVCSGDNMLLGNGDNSRSLPAPVVGLPCQ